LNRKKETLLFKTTKREEKSRGGSHEEKKESLKRVARVSEKIQDHVVERGGEGGAIEQADWRNQETRVIGTRSFWRGGG